MDHRNCRQIFFVVCVGILLAVSSATSVLAGSKVEEAVQQKFMKAKVGNSLKIKIHECAKDLNCDSAQDEATDSAARFFKDVNTRTLNGKILSDLVNEIRFEYVGVTDVLPKIKVEKGVATIPFASFKPRNPQGSSKLQPNCWYGSELDESFVKALTGSP